MSKKNNNNNKRKVGGQLGSRRNNRPQSYWYTLCETFDDGLKSNRWKTQAEFIRSSAAVDVTGNDKMVFSRALKKFRTGELRNVNQTRIRRKKKFNVDIANHIQETGTSRNKHLDEDNDDNGEDDMMINSGAEFVSQQQEEEEDDGGFKDFSEVEAAMESAKSFLTREGYPEVISELLSLAVHQMRSHRAKMARQQDITTLHQYGFTT